MKTLKNILTIIALSLTLINCGEMPPEYTGQTEYADVILPNCGSEFADPDNCHDLDAPVVEEADVIAPNNCDGENDTYDAITNTCQRVSWH